MSPADSVGWRGAASGLFRSYVADLRGWAGRLATRYAVAVAMTIGGILANFAAVAVGITALFHFIERQYGMDVAYGVIGGGLVAIGIILFLVAWTMLRRRVAPMPGPHRQAQSVKQMVVKSAMARALANPSEAEGMRADAATQVLIGAAAAVLIGWILASRLAARSERRRVGR
jgi:hypothetical protein